MKADYVENEGGYGDAAGKGKVQQCKFEEGRLVMEGGWFRNCALPVTNPCGWTGWGCWMVEGGRGLKGEADWDGVGKGGRREVLDWWGRNACMRCQKTSNTQVHSYMYLRPDIGHRSKRAL